MSRPTDWSALGLSSDPTPGDPDQVQDVYNLINTLATDYQTILDTINKVNGYADSGNLSGATADALKAQMNGRITNFVKSAQTAFSQAAPALQTYLNALNDHQTTADNLLTQAQNSGLKPTDDSVKGWASSAKQAGTDLQTAENTAATAIQNLPGPSDPLSPWQEFLQILGWIAILLILPAMIFGGVIALVEFVVNAVLFVNALVEFAQGKLSVGGLLLALLGVIAPTTRGINIGDLIDLAKGMGSFAKSGFLTIKAGLTDFMDLMVNTKFTDLLSMDSLIKLGNFALKGGAWILQGLKDLPSTVISAGTLFATKLGELFVDGGLKLFTSLKTGSFLSLVLPVDALEVEKLGLLAGLRLGFLDRGLGFTASPATNLSELAKLSLAGVKSSEFHFAGFGHLDVQRTTSSDINIGKGLNAALPNLNTDFRLATLDTHLAAPELSINNLAAGFTHDSLNIGTISMHTPQTNFGLNKLEMPDLRFPKELNNIGNGTIVVKMNDMSFVTVREDKLPGNIDVNAGNISVPALHTADVSVPAVHTTDVNVSAMHAADISIPNLHASDLNIASVHTGTVNVPAIHTTDVNVAAVHTNDLSLPTTHGLSTPNVSTTSVHISDNMNVSIPSLHMTNLNTADLHSVNLASSSVTKLPVADEMPNLSAIAHTQMNVAETRGFSVSQSDSGLRINNTNLSVEHVDVNVNMTTAETTHVDVSANLGSVNADVHLGTDTNLSTNSVHLASPDVNALQHLATNDGVGSVHLNPVTATPHLNAPQLDIRLGDDPHASFVPPEIKALQTNSEIPVHTSDSGIRVNIAEAQIAMHEEHIPVTPESSTAIPAVSSTGVEESAAHSAGSSGAEAHVAEPDLAGKPGLIDPGGEKLAVAWTDFKQAQHLYVEAKAEHDLQFHGSDPKFGEAGPAFKGKAPQTRAQLDAVDNLDAAAEKFGAASSKLEELHANPLDLTLQQHSDLTMSLNQNPRLVGGSRPGDAPLFVHPHTNETVLATRPIGGDHELVITFDANRTEFGEVVNVHTGETEFGGLLTEIDTHGGFRLDSPDTGEFREFHPDGTLVASEHLVTDASGAHFGTVTIDHTHSVADLTTPTEHLTGLDVDRATGGGIILGEANGWRTWRFDSSGQLSYEPMELFDHTGAPIQGMHFDHEGNLVQHFNDDGTTTDFAFTPAPNGSGGFRLGTGANHDVWQQYDVGGHLVGYGLPLQHADSHALGHFEIDLRPNPQGHQVTLIAPDGARGTQIPATVNGRLITITNLDGTTVDIAAHTGSAIVVRADIRTSVHGADFGTVHVDYLAGRATFTGPNALSRNWRFGHDDTHTGFTLVSTDHVHTLSFGANNELHFSWLTTRDPATGALTDMHIHTNYTGGPGATTHVFQAGDGRVLNGAQITRTANGDFIVTSIHPTSYTRGSFIEYNGRTGTVNTQRINLESFDNLHVLEDHVNVDATGNPTIIVRDGNDVPMPNFQATRTATGNIRVTNITAAQPHGSIAEFDGFAGAIQTHRVDLEGANGSHVLVDHVNVDAASNPTVIVHDANGNPINGFQAVRTGNQHFTLTDLRPGHGQNAFTEFHGMTGAIRTNRTNLEDFGNLHIFEDHVNVDAHGNSQIVVRDNTDAVMPNFQASRNAAGDFHVTNIAAGRTHGSIAEFDGDTGRMNFQRLDLQGRGGLHVHEDHITLTAAGNPTVTVRDAAGNPTGDFNAARFGNQHFMVTDVRPGHTQDAYTEFDGLAGTIRTNRTNLEHFGDLHVHEDHVNPDAAGNPRITIRDDNNAIHANFQATRTPTNDFHVSDTGIGHQPGSHAEFDGANGTMHYRRTQLEDFGNLHIFEDHVNLNAARHPTVTVRDSNGVAVGHFDLSTPAAGVVRLTDNRPGLTLGAYTEFDHATGAIRTRQIHLQDSSGLRVNVDHVNLDANNRPTLTVLDAHGVNVTRFTPGRTANGRGVTLTDTAAGHLGETRTINLDGRITGERIAIKDAKGVPTGDHFEVTFTEAAGVWTGRWTRVDVAARDATLPKAYNGAGSAVLKKNGTLELIGADKTALFSRERLSIGQELEVLKFPNGRRQWTSWADDGHLSDNGFRRFANDDAGVDSKDVNGVGMTIRQYRIGIDGGLVRGEKMPNGSFQWTRFDKDGAPKLTGDRSRTPIGAFGWKDVFHSPTGGAKDAQVHWSAFNTTTHAGHYREYGLSGDARAGFDVKTTYKEISQQGKDTGSLETIANNHTLQFVRYSEQRIPDFLWKWRTSKYGTIDFPHRGFWTGDSRFQVFSWIEKDAHEVEVAHGVRVATPDGSTFDFAGDGLLVRSVIKLDNGNKIEIGRAADGKWDNFRFDPAQPGTRPANTLPWRELDGDGTVVVSGTRTFAPDKTWIDTFTHNGNDYVARYANTDGNVVHFTSDAKPQFDAAQPRGNQFSLTAANGDRFPSITRNTIGQIVVRTDRFDGRAPGDFTGTGDPRVGNWRWNAPRTGTDGIRISGRNNPRKGWWDDSFADFEAHGGLNFQVRDLRSLDKGTSLRGWRDNNNVWQSAKFNAKGEIDNASLATREWKDSQGIYQALPEGARTPKMADWRDFRIDPATGNRIVVRESIDGKVRVYTDPANHGTNVWKEYDFGSVWRQRDAVTEVHTSTDVNGNVVNTNRTYFVEKESFQKQWRMTTAAGVLIRYRGISGNVMERNAFGQWMKVGTEREAKGLVPQLNEFRGWNRLIRETNRMQFNEPGWLRPGSADGAVGAFTGTWTRIGQKTVFDFLQDYFIDVAANIIITGAVDGWNFNGGQWGQILVGGAVRSGVKAGYGLMTETVLKEFRDGLRNIDGGKDWNRQPYNNDKHWDNEWAGNENPTRWRSGTFDYFVGNTFVPALGSFFATLITGSTFGVGKEDTQLSGADLWKAAGLSMAGSMVGGLTFGAIRTLGHVGLSGRWFHQGGVADITLQFGEKMAIDWLVNDFLSHADGLSAGHVAKIVAAGQESSNPNGTGNGNGSGTPQGQA